METFITYIRLFTVLQLSEIVGDIDKKDFFTYYPFHIARFGEPGPSRLAIQRRWRNDSGTMETAVGDWGRGVRSVNSETGRNLLTSRLLEEEDNNDHRAR